MAVDTTVFTPALEKFPYSGMDTLGGDRSGNPFAEIGYAVVGGAIAVEAGGDSQKIDVQCNLPVNFAFSLMSLSAKLSGTDIADWEAVADCFMTDGATTGGEKRTKLIAIPSWSEGITGTDKVRIYRFDFKGLGVILPGNAVSIPQIRFILSNDTVDGSAMTLNFFARVLQFNIEQAYYFAVNSPMPVR